MQGTDPSGEGVERRARYVTPDLPSYACLVGGREKTKKGEGNKWDENK